MLRTMNFNLVNINIFIDQYESVLNKYKFEVHKI